MTNDSVVRHLSRQRYLRALNWKAPAVAMTAAPMAQPLKVSHERPVTAALRAASAACAAMPKTNHADR